MTHEHLSFEAFHRAWIGLPRWNRRIMTANVCGSARLGIFVIDPPPHGAGDYCPLADLARPSSAAAMALKSSSRPVVPCRTLSASGAV